MKSTIIILTTFFALAFISEQALNADSGYRIKKKTEKVENQKPIRIQKVEPVTLGEVKPIVRGPITIKSRPIISEPIGIVDSQNENGRTERTAGRNLAFLS